MINFLRVRRLQAGILPEVGGKDATPEAEKGRDRIISLAVRKLFSEFKKQNPFANKISFTAEWIFVQAQKE